MSDAAAISNACHQLADICDTLVPIGMRAPSHPVFVDLDCARRDIREAQVRLRRVLAVYEPGNDRFIGIDTRAGGARR